MPAKNTRFNRRQQQALLIQSRPKLYRKGDCRLRISLTIRNASGVTCSLWFRAHDRYHCSLVVEGFRAVSVLYLEHQPFLHALFSYHLFPCLFPLIFAQCSLLAVAEVFITFFFLFHLRFDLLLSSTISVVLRNGLMLPLASLLPAFSSV